MTSSGHVAGVKSNIFGCTIYHLKLVLRKGEGMFPDDQKKPGLNRVMKCIIPETYLFHRDI